MKPAMFLLGFLLCASCTTTERRSTGAGRPIVSLPRLSVEGVRFEDGLDESEAATLASEYFHRMVAGCGMPSKPKDEGGFWRFQLWGGYAGSDHGTLRIAKDGSEALLEPPGGGFKSSTRQLLEQSHSP